MAEAVAVKALARTYVVVPAATLTYALVLHQLYVSLISPAFGYMGYRYVEAPFESIVVAWLATTGVACMLPKSPIRASAIILWVLFIVVVAPTMLTLPYMGVWSPWQGVGFGLGLGFAFIITVLVSRRLGPTRPLPLSLSPMSFWLVLGAFTALTYVYVAITVGLSFQFLSIFDAYDTRSDYREVLAEATLLGYLVSTQANVVNPLIIAYAIQQRRWVVVLIAAAGQLVLYSSTGFKTILFSLAAILVIIVFFKLARTPRLIALLWGASALLMLTWALDLLSNTAAWSSLFGRRFLYTPARLSGLYFDWYSNNPLSLMGNSILAPFVQTDYEYGPARTIAIYATGSPVASLNANVYASGFAEFGWVGVAGVAVLLGVYLRVLDRSAHGLQVWVAAVVAVMPAVALSNTAFHTALLSHGLIAGVVLLAIAPREKFAPREGQGSLHGSTASDSVLTRRTRPAG